MILKSINDGLSVTFNLDSNSKKYQTNLTNFGMIWSFSFISLHKIHNLDSWKVGKFSLYCNYTRVIFVIFRTNYSIRFFYIWNSWVVILSKKLMYLVYIDNIDKFLFIKL